jgi:UDP-N-acetylglucosamine enolpyruvyl transferase
VVTHGELRIRNAGNQYLDMIRYVFRRLGVTWEVEGEDILVPAKQRLKIEPDLGNAIPEIKSNVWPGFPTDLVSIAITVATQARGSVLFHDWMYPGRMYFTDKLVAMGAQIVLCDPHRVIVTGPPSCTAKAWKVPISAPAWRCCWRRWPCRANPPSAMSARSTAATSGWMKNCVPWARILSA